MTVLPLYVFAHFSHHLLTALPGPLLVFIRPYFGLDYAQAAVVTTTFSLAYGVGQLPAGWLADHVGRKVLLGIGILGVAAAGLLVGLSQTYIMLLVFLAIMGLAGGGYHPSSAPMISAAADPKSRGRALGIHGIGGSSAFFLAPLVGAAIARAWGWHMSFVILAVPTAVFGVVFLWLLRRQASNGQAASGERKTAEAAYVAPPGRWRRLVAFMIMVVVGGGIAGSVGPFMTLFFNEEFGLSQAAAASLPAIGNSAGLWAAVVGGHLSDRWGKTPIIVGTTLAAGAIILSYSVVPWGPGFIVLLLLSGIMMYTRMPVAELFIIGLTAPKHRSTVYGIYYFATMEASAIFAPFMGRLIGANGFQPTFMLVGSISITITLICAVFLWRNRD